MQSFSSCYDCCISARTILSAICISRVNSSTQVMNTTPIRLSKYLSQQGICSRRQAEFFIGQGWVTVDGTVVCKLATKVNQQNSIVLSEDAHRYRERLLTILLHKPVGYVSSQPEKQYKPAISLITARTQYNRSSSKQAERVKWPLKGYAVAGRLDIDSSGLLVLTQDGTVARKLIHPQSDVEKEYLVRVEQTVSPKQLRTLEHGLSLDGVELKRAEVDLLDENYLRMILKQGRKRQIRRMCEAVGLRVVALKRVRIGSVALASLPSGKWRVLGSKESF